MKAVAHIREQACLECADRCELFGRIDLAAAASACPRGVWRAWTPHPRISAHRRTGTLRVERPAGPGSELKSILRTIGVKATMGCKCNQRAAEMDRRGAAWCRAHLEEIVGWLAESYGSPGRLVRFGLKPLVRLAIRRAERGAPGSR